MTKPFHGIRVLDFSQVISGPYATAMLALQGADVIKFERPPLGDESRTFCLNPELLANGCGSAYLSINAGKRSLSLDLKKPQAIEAIWKLIVDADVIVENFRPGVMTKLGLGYDEVKKQNTDIIYCSISGYGQTGPEAQSPAYDGAIQAASGIMSITGHPEKGPTRVGFPFSDVAAGSAAAFAIASAIYRRQMTGDGQYIDLAMIDASLSMMAPIVGFCLIGGETPYQIGNLAWSRRPTSDMFPTKDDHLMLVVNSEAHFRLFCSVLEMDEILSDNRFSNWALRQQNAGELRALIERALASDTAASWAKRLKEAGIAAARVATIPDVLSSEQTKHRGLVMTLPGTDEHPDPISVLNAPFQSPFDGPGTDRPPPACGQHNEEILDSLGYSPAEIDKFCREGAIWKRP